MARVKRSDVAKLAGVAPSTVSLVLNGRGEQVKLSSDTIERVQKAARELNYIPNSTARSLRLGGSRLIGLVLAELPDDPFVPVIHKVLTSAMIEARRSDYFILPLHQQHDLGEADLISALKNVELAGVLCETTSAPDFVSQVMDSQRIPLVWLELIESDQDFKGDGIVRLDETAGVKEILAELDIPQDAKVFFLAGPYQHHHRHLPILAHFEANGSMLRLPDWQAESAYRASLKLLNENPDIKLIWCADDSQASGVFRAARELEIQIPQQLSVIGFGNHVPEEADILGLTTVDWPLETMTKEAVKLLTQTLSGKEPNSESHCQTRAVWRSSAKRTTEPSTSDRTI
ncbi:hypothetical protein BSR29_04320 [Boudabousia liubingyangii]|uniref:HTH lacI-type domain-containing protein n=1 Tax=Boudabousia liubingyangii TaxID=1921764 RepID=A0A1Q5PNF4_9ACTO|nr:LacI family DNA-binding transcriptional regulator [Boudabousia liubingyangii]OKL49063.1 hypothetical protein BSR29_04320 [Boudabousia liubingyangii]